MKNINDNFEFYYTLAKKKIGLHLWSVDYAKGYMFCYLNNVLVNLSDDKYDEYAKLIDDLG